MSFGYQVLGFGAGGGASFTVAEGGTETEDGNYKIHTFNSGGTFTVTKVGGDASVDYLVIAGGAGGGGGYAGGAGGGSGPGGGA